MKCFLNLVLASAALSIFSAAADVRAVQIAYITSGVGSGFLNNVPFSNEPFTITAVADTTQVQDNPYSFGVNNISTTVLLDANILVASAGSSYSGKPTLPEYSAYMWSNSLVGDFIDTPEVYVVNPGFDGYDLKTNIGPLAATQSGFTVILTNQGPLFFQSVSQAQFMATILPEPSTLALLAMAGLTCWRGRRSR